MTKKLLFVVAILCALTLAVMAADVSGKWTFETQGRNGNKTQTLILKADGSKLTGSLDGGRGPADNARAMAAAKDAGYDTARIEKDLANPEVKATIEENIKLAEEMGLNGTPSYVIGKQIVVGAVGLQGLKEKIGIARCGKATC